MPLFKTPQSKSLSLTQTDIEENVARGDYSRGLAYFKQGRVRKLHAEEISITLAARTVELLAEVQGSRVYEQEITIDWDEDAEVSIYGACTCPVEHNCKHVAAACLHYMATLPASKSDSSACFTWLDEFNNTVDGIGVAQHVREDFIAYLLSHTKQPGKLRVQFAVTRTLKNGKTGKGRIINLENLTSTYYSSTPLTPLDTAIGELLSVKQDYHWNESLIAGETGFLALSKIVQSRRAFWINTQGQTFAIGDDRALSLQWQKDADGNAKLEVIVEGGGEVLLTEPLLYCDPNSLAIGHLTNAPYSIAQMEKLLRAPVVPAKLVNQFSQKMVQSRALRTISPPQAITTETISACVPVPCLLLSRREEQGHAFHLIRLRYRYQAHEITALPQDALAVISENEKIVRIERDIQLENAAIATLCEYGFDVMADRTQTELIFLSVGQHNPLEGLQRWQHFIDQAIPTLRARAWEITIDDSFTLRFHQPDHWDVIIGEEDNGGWFDLRFDIKIANRPVALLPLIAAALNHFEPNNLPETVPLHLGENEFVSVPRAQIKPILDLLYELYDRDNGLSDGALRLSRFDTARLVDLENKHTDFRWHGGKSQRQLGRKLQDFNGIVSAPPPKGLHASLRPYQQQGLNWLQFLREYEFGGILADDMGLGKTVQTLSHLLLEKEQGRMDKPCLIIAPTSLMSNWYREIEQFAPALKVLVLQGPDRHQYFSQIQHNDIVLSTYPLLARDEEVLLAQDYHVLVLDEAQVVKNPRAVAAQVVRRIKARQRVCLTGTPMENHLGELWALFDFLMPGFLGHQKQFTQWFRTPIEKHNNNEQRQRLSKRVAPFMLRRTKTEVVQELPEKTEIIRNVSLGSKQAALYESIRIAMEKKVRDAIANKGLARSHIMILDALLKLRQVCCDPRLLPLKNAKAVNESAKLELLMQILPEMIEEGRRVLLFSQFTTMLELIEQELDRASISYTKLTGQTRDRDRAISRFKNGDVPVFLISLKAGGVGLNLTEADTVIHYDPWWNPATENQATDRAHRIGQDKAVFVYKLVTENSVEEKILALQAKKQKLADGIYHQDNQAQDLKLNAEDLQQLFAPLG